MQIVDYIPYIVMALTFLINALSALYARKTGKSIKSEVSQFMKYKLPNYRETEKSPEQSFDPLVPQYRFNKETGELEQLPDMLDVQKLVDSSLNTSLESMLDRFLPTDKISNLEADLSDTRDTLDRLASAMDFAEELKDKLGLDEFASLNDVQSALDKVEAEQIAKVKAEQEAKKADLEKQALFAQFEAFIKSQKGGEPNE